MRSKPTIVLLDSRGEGGMLSVDPDYGPNKEVLIHVYQVHGPDGQPEESWAEVRLSRDDALWMAEFLLTVCGRAARLLDDH